MRHFLQISWMALVCLLAAQNSTAQCPLFAGVDSLLCGFSTILSAEPDGGIWSVVCDESAGIVEFSDADSTETLVTVSECGTYTFVYGLDIPDCMAEDTVKIGFEGPNYYSITGGADIGLEVDYQCPNSASDCSSTISIPGLSPPVFSWSMNLLKECCPILYETIVQNPTGNCEADIAIEVIIPTDCTISEADWIGSQGDLVNVDGAIVSANFFDIYLPLLESLADCDITGEVENCSFDDIPEACQGEVGFINDTLIVEIPYSTGEGQWHYVEDNGDLTALEDTTQLPPPYEFATLIIDPNSNYIGPDSITFSAWETDVTGVLLFPLSQFLNLENRIQWVYTVEYVADTLIREVAICETGNCDCGCGSIGFFPDIDIPMPDLYCPPISLSFSPSGSGGVFWELSFFVFCEDEGSFAPDVTVIDTGCEDIEYLFSGSPGLVIDPTTGEIFIDGSEPGIHEAYVSNSNGSFDVLIIEILPIEFIEFELPPDMTTCPDEQIDIQPIITSGDSFNGFWSMDSNVGTIDAITGTINISPTESTTLTVSYYPNSPCGYIVSKTMEIIVIESIEPNLNCSTTTDSISFDWDMPIDNPPYTIIYSINGGNSAIIDFTGNYFTIDNLLPGDEILFTLYDVWCGSWAISMTCFIPPCPDITLQINNLNTAYCISESATEILGIPAGGVFLINDNSSNTFSPTNLGAGNHLVEYIWEEGACSYTTEMTVQVFPEPIADFNLTDSNICLTNKTTVEYIGSINLGTVLTWDFDGGTAENTTGGTDLYEVSWTTTGIKNISLQVEENGCNSPLSEQSIEVIAPIEAVAITCGDSDTDMVSFNWSEVAGYDFEVTYAINGQNPIIQTISNNSLEINNLNPQDAVEISVLVLNDGICGNSEISTQVCMSQDCPTVELNIENLADEYCSNTTAIPLTANIGGGMFSINGNEQTIFAPVVLGTGNHLVAYTLEDRNCSYTSNMTVEVIAPIEAVVITCGNSGTDMVSFNWNEVAGYDFEVTYTVNGQNPISQITSNNSFEVNSLNPQDVVEISVLVLNSGVCGNSEIASQTCVAQDCPMVELNIEGLAGEYCSNATAIPLSANIGGGTFTINGNTETVFNSAILGVGNHLVAYTLEDNNCSYSSNMTVEVISPIEAVVITCGDSDTNIVSFNWNDATGYDFEVTYTVNGQNSISQTTSNNSLEVGNLNPQDVVEISVLVLNSGVCGNSEIASQTCVAQDCPTVELNIENLAGEYCSNATAIPLTANIGGGTFTINENEQTIFDPFILSVGNHLVEYTLEDNNCSYSSNMTVEVIAPIEAVVITCEDSGTDMVSFNWSEVTGYDFEVTYTVNGQNPTSQITSNNSFEVNSLNPQDEVEISVLVLNSSVCGNSETASQTCVAQDCPTMELNIENLVGEYCSNVTTIPLTANIGGGIFTINGNTATVFDPFVLGVGIHLVEYIWVDNNCSYSSNMTVEVISPIEAVAITCGNSDTDIVSFNWSEVTGYDFEVTYTINGQNPISQTTSNNSFEVDNLNPQDAIEISVLVLNSGVCGNSPVSTQTCVTMPMETCELPSPDLLSCIAITETTMEFRWEEVAESVGYEITLGAAATGTFTQAETTFLVEDLSGSQEVNIQVIALAAEDCENSLPAQIGCFTLPAKVCPTAEEVSAAMLVPTAFSPNEDGVNDAFKAVFPFTPTDYDFQVFNRWGERIFWSQDSNKAWDGFDSTSLQAAHLGVYVWHIRATLENECGEIVAVQKQGNLTLLR